MFSFHRVVMSEKDQVLSLAASAMTKSSSYLTDKSHISFSNFYFSKACWVWVGLIEGGGVGECLVGWFWHSGFGFLSPEKFRLLHSVLLFLCAWCHQLQALSCFSIAGSGDPSTHETRYVVSLAAFHHLFQIPFGHIQTKNTSWLRGGRGWGEHEGVGRCLSKYKLRKKDIYICLALAVHVKSFHIDVISLLVSVALLAQQFSILTKLLSWDKTLLITSAVPYSWQIIQATCNIKSPFINEVRTPQWNKFTPQRCISLQIFHAQATTVSPHPSHKAVEFNCAANVYCSPISSPILVLCSTNQPWSTLFTGPAVGWALALGQTDLLHS